MSGFLERIGLVRTEYDGPPPPPALHPAEEQLVPDGPEIDASRISQDGVVQSVYLQCGIDDTSSIFKIQSYIDVLPAEMTKSKKQASIAGILSVNGIHAADLIADGENRVRALKASAWSVGAESEATVIDAEEDIERLKSLIEAAEGKIAASKKKASDACAEIQEEIDAISQLLEFANGIAGGEGDQSCSS